MALLDLPFGEAEALGTCEVTPVIVAFLDLTFGEAEAVGTCEVTPEVALLDLAFEEAAGAGDWCPPDPETKNFFAD